MTWTSIDPSTGDVVTRVPETSAEEAEEALDAALRAQRQWRRASFAERAAVLERAAELLRARVDAHAELMAREMGKPVRQGRAEVEKCAWVCEYYADRAEDQLAPVQPDASDLAGRAYVAFEPLGTVLAVMPWNFPFWQVFRFAAPTLMAGNATLLKHAPNVPGCARAIERVFTEAGLPEGLFRSLYIDVERTHALIRDRRVAAVTLTGSVRAGRAVAATAGEALKKTVLELGGSDPYIVLADADLDRAAGACVESRLINSGQSCIAAKRFIVLDEVYEAFLERVIAGMSAARVGSPLDEATDVGPLARLDLRDALHEQVARSVGAGARCVLGGEPAGGPGAFYPPTVLVDAPAGSPAYREELFGPVAVVLRARDEAEAVRLANDTPFGLGGGVFTRDAARGEALARYELEVGSAFVNTYVRSDPRLPFGGVKESGYGRELGAFGIREFVNVKTIWVEGDVR
ncbi:MAG: NAD-dependent succinate-semialdehyde dehydrogenase [Gemmatimonadetes bacterium]|nr:MAG: NAD-dependent succinate-semialdehyde dehydrogenase [Gemmatimonadota bacterium]